MTWGPLPLGSPKIGIQPVGFGPCDTQISVGTIFGPRGPDRYLIELWEPYKWPKIYKWVTGVITLLMGVITLFVTGRGPPGNDCTGVRKLRIFVPPFWI